MTYFLVLATGARLLEQTMMQRPGYPRVRRRRLQSARPPAAQEVSRAGVADSAIQSGRGPAPNHS